MSNRTVQFTVPQAAQLRANLPQSPAPAPPPHGAPPRGPAGQAPAGLGIVPIGGRTEHPLLVPMYWACADVLAFSPQLGSGATLPTPDVLRNTIGQMFHTMAYRGQESNIPPEDVRDAQYAIAALLDEQILRCQWHGNSDWKFNRLGRMYFQDVTAGEGFFRRLDALRAEPHRAHVLQIYFLCLAMGFQGRYALMGGEGLANVFEQTAASLDRFVPPSDVMSPHGEPPDLGRNMFTRDMPLLRIGIGILVLALVVFIALKVIVGLSASSATQQMKDYAPTVSPAKAP